MKVNCPWLSAAVSVKNVTVISTPKRCLLQGYAQVAEKYAQYKLKEAGRIHTPLVTLTGFTLMANILLKVVLPSILS